MQGNKACHVAILHAGAIDKRTARAFGTKGALGQRILRTHHAAIGAARSNAVEARICRQAPVLVIGIVVELPFKSKFAGFKIIAGDHAIARERGFRQVNRGGSLASAGRNRPAVLPFHRHQVRHTSNRAGIAEQKCIPLAIGSIKDASLRNAVIGEEVPSAVTGKQALGAVNNFATALARRPGNREQVVFTVHLLHVRAFLLHIVVAGAGHLVDAHAANLATLAAGLYTARVVVQLHVANLVATAVEHPHGAIVIEEQRRVVVERELHFAPLAAFHVGGFVQMRLARRVRRCQHVEESLVVTDARSPRALAVGILAAIQVLLVVVGERLVGIAHRAPLGQIGALENGHARGKVHGRRHHVVSIVDTDNRGVRAIDVHDRVIDRNGTSNSGRNQGYASQELKASHFLTPLFERTTART